MKYLRLPDNETHILPFYLSMEEYAAHVYGDDSLFFMWQVEPTVIFGRNQVIQNEVNLDYCDEHGIQYYRRKSGGGCVYADMGNIMMSYITRSDNVMTTFSQYTAAVVRMLKALGLNASDNSRNDIMIDGLKVSGNAFYHMPGYSIVHGTMLYDTHMEHMAHAISPSATKLESKGVKSVSSRITTLSQHLTMGIGEFKEHVVGSMCDGEIVLTSADVERIEQIMQGYLAPEFIMGNNPRCNATRRAYIDNVGEIEVKFSLAHNVINDMNITGDYFLLGDIDHLVINRLNGTPFTRAALENALRDTALEEIILNLDKQTFINLLIS
ncbi:MAG: lipoyltransferase [Muribaculaceae bacterium]|nr:lipoyltransferase [Muribaculaceae bacterium]